MLGQYFTTNRELQQKVYNLITNEPSTILEPSVGKGHLVQYVLSQKPHIEFDCYEIDETVFDNTAVIDKTMVVFNDFLTTSIGKKYDTIIGNPPYVKTKSINLYLLFIEKCIELLNPNGELIFITPSDCFKQTSGIPIYDKIFKIGSITHIHHPNNETLFDNARIDVIVFRYQLGGESMKINYNGVLYPYYTNSFLYIGEKNGCNQIEDLFDIYVGIVSGCNSVFSHSVMGNENVLTSGGVKRFIITHKNPSDNTDIDDYLLLNKDKLINRRIRKFNDNNWFEWGALRNIKFMRENAGKECIYIKNISRQKTIAFVGTVQLFDGSLLCMYPKPPTTTLEDVVQLINSDVFKINFVYSNRFRITHKQLSKVYI